MSSTTVLVLGATGFVGRHVLAALRDAQVRVIAGCREPARLDPSFRGEVRAGDLLDPEYRVRVFEGVDVVCYAAAWSALYGHAEASRARYLEPGLACIDAAVAAGVERFVLTSALNVRGVSRSRFRGIREGLPATWPHLANVIALEAHMQARAGTTRMVALRFGHFSGVGGGLGIMPVLLPRLRARLVPWLERGAVPLPLVDGADIGQAFLRAALAEGLEPWQAIDVVGPEVPTFREVLRLLHDVYGLPQPWFSVSLDTAFRFAHGAELVARLSGRAPLLTRSIVFLSEPLTPDPLGAARIGYAPRVPWSASVRGQVNELLEARRPARLVDALPAPGGAG
ncbi:MAG: NAD(P)H-binding protein [Deltaproteobacteria bacterium]|nr:NAD(P)H-binding protein [Deltaproteobacteria bacterium]